LQKELAELADTQSEMDKIRADENKAYEATVSDLKDTIDAVDQCIEEEE